MTQQLREALERRGRRWGEWNQRQLAAMRHQLTELGRKCPGTFETRFAGKTSLGSGSYVVAQHASTD